MAEFQVRTDVPGEFLNVHGHTLRRQLNQSIVAQVLAILVGITSMVLLIVLLDKKQVSTTSTTTTTAITLDGSFYTTVQDSKCPQIWFQPGCSGVALLSGFGLPDRRVAWIPGSCLTNDISLMILTFSSTLPAANPTCLRITDLGTQGYTLSAKFTQGTDAIVVLTTAVSSDTPATIVSVPSSLQSWVQSIVPQIH